MIVLASYLCSITGEDKQTKENQKSMTKSHHDMIRRRTSEIEIAGRWALL
jgi:hypothetical protein